MKETKIMKVFEQYIKKFDMNKGNVKAMYFHSIKMMELCKDIATNLGFFTEEEIKVCGLIGLFHDIGRFEQWTKYKTFVDSESIDHGDLSVEILKDIIPKITRDEYLQNVILIAIKNHNKFKIEENLDEKCIIMAKIVRDADKLDILTEQGNIIKRNHELNNKLLKDLMNHRMINNIDVKNEMDSILRLIGFIFDLNFKYSISYILDEDIVKNKINLIEIYSGINLKKLEDNLIDYLKEEYHAR